jgi:plasmid stability protein
MHSFESAFKYPMANLTIRKLDPIVKECLRLRAARHGHSMEEEARRILNEACRTESASDNAYARLRRHFADIGGIELELPQRRPGREPPDFD